jgi:hypothetical protein
MTRVGDRHVWLCPVAMSVRTLRLIRLSCNVAISISVYDKCLPLYCQYCFSMGYLCGLFYDAVSKTNSMDSSHSREAASCAATQGFPNILGNPKVHYRVHKGPLCQSPKPFLTFRNKLIFLRWGGPPLVGLSATAYSIYSQLPSICGGHLLHPQPEDAPCLGDKGHT